MWLRHILPAHLMHLPIEYVIPTCELRLHHIIPNVADLGSGTYFGDVLGGQYTQYT
jgi:hypothetical protein